MIGGDMARISVDVFLRVASPPLAQAIPVFFKVHEESAAEGQLYANDAGFSVAKEKAHVTATRISERLDNGGFVWLFPEARLNERPATLQPFRFGAFEVAHERDVEVWALAMVGCEVAWPLGGVGGYPAEVVGTLFPIAPDGARALCDTFTTDAGAPKPHAQLLAEHSGALFQQVIDGLHGKKVA